MISYFPMLFLWAQKFLRHQILHRSMMGASPLSQNKWPLNNVGKHLTATWQVGMCSLVGCRGKGAITQAVILISQHFPAFYLLSNLLTMRASTFLPCGFVGLASLVGYFRQGGQSSRCPLAYEENLVLCHWLNILTWVVVGCMFLWHPISDGSMDGTSLLYEDVKMLRNVGKSLTITCLSRSILIYKLPWLKR